MVEYVAGKRATEKGAGYPFQHPTSTMKGAPRRHATGRQSRRKFPEVIPSTDTLGCDVDSDASPNQAFDRKLIQRLPILGE